MIDRPSPIRPTDDEARRQARTLLRSATHVPLGVLDPQTGGPFVSRVLMGTMPDGTLTVLVSRLSAHTRAMLADPRVSLLAGEPGKGDPLAYPRLTVQCLASPVDPDSDIHQAMRRRFLARHPKAKLYIDFPDFLFFQLMPQRAAMNGGFGKAFLLDGEDLLIRTELTFADGKTEAQTIQDLGYGLLQIIKNPPYHKGQKPKGKVKICGLDASGIDFFWGKRLFRCEFEREIVSLDTHPSLQSN
ncbi:HugZ family protein [Agrobacterium vitis]|uniref:HugZ family pyridoxamine 5'-phosphate oxidase n=1 Tax=Rhizobium/Agrobacterium group TaxID=227290 RepID=UPI0008DC094D|nr:MULTISPECIES: pyridoxamine 5'-phosphate oxidase family protein [Rhizobium/Agrobacterium group]MCF1433554.1 HugZ family protein [Allorhizobium ampelinum]MUO90787.1 HugZ family protein [Agrobacterium vitis]MUZ54148.1 HugZ family protein [Agrobacterium vitis]MUZ92822.1 HugZ family protein [Agrobacterium vitis]MVA40582.1 HugZ family protein [Agrobacterium vitis]